MGQIARKTTLLVGLALASIVANSGCGCDLSNLIGFPIPVASDSVLVIIENEAGAEVRVDATFTFSQEDVRKTSRVLDAEGAGATTAILRTVAERIDVKATATGDSASAQVISNLITPGEVLLDVTLRLNIDYFGGDTIVITIRNPIDDCNGNGIDDADEIASGAADDCDKNGIPDDCQPDVDNDGVIDGCDNCLSIANADQKDDDNNGLGDVCELGACQLSATCIETTLTLCTNQDGTFGGVGTDCGAGNPLPTGACCTGNTCNTTTQAICQAGNGTYLGDQTTCSSNTCATPEGACCLGNGNCIDATESSCSNLEGDYKGDGTSCETTQCPQPTGACCSDGTSCSIETEAACNQLEGSYLGNGTICEASTCLPTGACCYQEFEVGTACDVITQSECNQRKGTYLGDNSHCDGDPCNPPTGACCLVAGIPTIGEPCNILTEDLCGSLQGSYLGDGTTCDGDPCSPPTGACCTVFNRGSISTDCLELTELECSNFDGDYLGDDTTCDGNPCSPPTGACCYGSFCSSNLTQHTCEIEGGTYLGDDSTCDGEPCGPPTGACCLFNDTCMDLTESSCYFMKGDFIGYDRACWEITCDQEIVANISADRDWIYENIPSMSVPPTNCTVALTALISNDPLNNSSYTFTWSVEAPFDAPNAEMTLVSGDGTENVVYRGPNRPGVSPHGFSQYVEVLIYGNDAGNYGRAYIFIDIRLLGDVDNSGCTNSVDRQLITDVIDGEVTDPDIILAADVNCDGSVDVLDSQTALYVELNTDGNGSCIPD
ncbi:MAG: hypothetical protein H6818_10370 [Phycisphaerales bacterium]|nr:hypothetical protein [Phycisphaerales bacterium]MCB9863894.1 hypothetical protein [Phycisphaerales bacterium]